MTNPLGANWQTTISGIGSAVFAFLTMLAAVPYELGSLSTIISPHWKATIALYCGLAALALRCWNAYQTKSKSVTGGSTQQDADGNVAKPQEPTPPPPLPATPEPAPVPSVVKVAVSRKKVTRIK